MIIRNLAVDGFRSFREDSVLRFPRRAGFFLLSGDNRVESNLGANGAGKSSVWDALVWAFYGKTARGLRASNVANWDRSALCSVLVEFDVGKIEYSLARTWNPNSLSLGIVGEEPRVVTQEELLDIIRIDYGSFLNTVLMGQFNRFFFDLTPTEKLQVFSDALDLDGWLEASKKANVLAKGELANVDKLNRSVSTLLGRRKEIKPQLRQIRYDLEAHDKLVASKIVANEKLLADLLVEEKEDQEELARVQKEVVSADAHREGFNKILLRLDDTKKELEKEYQEVQVLAAKHDFSSYSLRREIEKFQEADGVCPYCKQVITDEHCAMELDKLGGSLVESEGAWAHWTFALKELQFYIDGKQEDMDEASYRMDACDSRRRRLGDERARAGSKVRESKAGIVCIEEKLELLRRQGNPYKQTLKDVRKRLTDVKAMLEDSKDRLEETKLSHAGYVYWVQGFKELRLWLVEEALREFEVRVNNSLLQLGLVGWEVTFAVERETKSGTVSKGFAVSIAAPGAKDAVPWEVWSGGETQRLRIAGAIGLSSLISGRLGAECNVEVWDEPTAHLSEEGIQDLLSFFEDRASSEGKQIWLVDHRSLDYGGFDDEVVVVKDDSGSHIVQGINTVDM